MRVAVTGATGYVGSALRRALAARGDAWRGLTRRPTPAGGGGEWVEGELADSGALERLLRGADAVVHAAAWVHREAPDPASREACFAVNLRGTERLIDAMQRAGGRAPLVFVSSTSVYGEAFEGRSESGPHQPAGAYGESKRAAEHAVLRFAAARPAMVIRPAMVYGPGAPGNIARLAAWVRRGFAPLVRGGTNRKSIVHADDLALALLAAVDRAADCSGAIFNAASEPAPSMREVGDALAAGLGKRLTWIPVPGPVWNAVAGLGHWRASASGGRVPDLGRTMEVYRSTTTVVAAAIRERLGVGFRAARDGLIETMRKEAAR